MRQAEENVEAEIVDRLEIPLHAYEIGKLKKKNHGNTILPRLH